MGILQRYLLKEMILPFIFGVTAFTSIFIGADVLFRLVNMVMEYGISLGVAGRLLLLSLPEIIVLTFPMSILLATLLAFGRLSGTNEITAMKAGGISFYSMVIPALLVGLFMSGLTIFINESLVPRTQEEYNQLIWRIRHDEPLPSTQRHLFFSPIDRGTGRVDFIVYAYHFDREGRYMEELTIHDYVHGEVRRIIEAREARWEGSTWQLIDGTIYELDRSGRLPMMTFATYTLQDFERSPEEISMSQKRPNEMSLKELSSFIAMRREDGRDVDSLIVLYHQRLSLPFSCLIFAMIGSPLGLKPNRSGSSIGLGLSIIIIFIYYVLMTIGSAMGQNSFISPVLGAWTQNVVFFFVGLFLLWKKAR